jgi:nucleotide-binding universal stress UspA family protein
MALKHLLVHMDSSGRTAERLGLAVALARQHGAQLTGLFAESGQLGPAVVARRNPVRMKEAMEAARAAFEAKADEARLAKDWWQIEAGDYATVISWTVVCCRYVDLAVFGQREDRDDRTPEDLLEQVLLYAGRPMLVVPGAGRYAEVGRRVLVVWTGSRESARALNDAMPILRGADEVALLAFQQPSVGSSGGPAPAVDVTAHLRAHGVRARYERQILDELGMVDTVLNYAADWSADLTVVGGYQHHGFPFFQRSTTVRDLLRSMTTPVLLSH